MAELRLKHSRTLHVPLLPLPPSSIASVLVGKLFALLRRSREISAVFLSFHPDMVFASNAAIWHLTRTSVPFKCKW